jgi:hypothetical protein
MTSKDNSEILNFKICGEKQYLSGLKSTSEFLCIGNKETQEKIKSACLLPTVETDNAQTLKQKLK